MNHLNLIINSAAGEHSFAHGDQKCLCSDFTIPKGVAKIIVKFLNRDGANSLLRVSKAWAAVVLEERAYTKLMTRLIKGFESLFEEHLRNIFVDQPDCIVVYTRVFPELRAKSIQKNCRFFKLDELALMNGFWEDYLQIRRIEYTFCDAVMLEKPVVVRNKEIKWDEATCNMVGPFLKKLIAEFQLEKAEDAILLKFTPLIVEALRRDGSVEWQEKLNTINCFVTTVTGKKLSAMETAWHLDFRQLRTKK